VDHFGRQFGRSTQAIEQNGSSESGHSKTHEPLALDLLACPPLLIPGWFARNPFRLVPPLYTCDGSVLRIT